MGLLIFGVRVFIASVFAVAGVAKLADRAGSEQSVIEFGVPAALARPVAWLLPVVEMACAVALLLGSWSQAGAVAALALFVLFTAAISINLLRGRRPACHCFGQLHAAPIGWTTVVRNACLAALSAMIVWEGPGPGGVFTELAKNGINVAVLVLGTIVCLETVGGAWLLYLLLKQNGRVLRRLAALESKVGISTDPSKPGLPTGSAAPTFRLADLEGRLRSLEMLGHAGKPLLLLFIEPECTACTTLLPIAAAWQKEHRDRLVVVPFSSGSVEANLAKAKDAGLAGILLQQNREVASAYDVVGSPGAVLVRDGRIASEVALGLESIRALVERSVVPAPLAKGERIRSVRLRDLAGGTMDVSHLVGQRRLLLFWNPSCGYCRAMLNDVKAWERAQPEDSLELVVIAGGSPLANREQGFRSRVLLDSKFEVSDMFGVIGTPSAVLIDEQGRVASDVAVGAEQALTLAGAIPDSILA